MPRNRRHGSDALGHLGEVGQRRVAKVSEREVASSLVADHQGGGLSQRPAVVIAAEDEAIGRGDCFELKAREWRELERAAFAFLVDVGRDPDLEIAELVVLGRAKLLIEVRSLCRMVPKRSFN
jgi:hypothetical protein